MADTGIKSGQDSRRVERAGSYGDDKVKDWHYQLDRGIRRREAEEDQWACNERAASPDLTSAVYTEVDYGNTSANKVGSFLRNHRASIAFNNPRVKLTPLTSDGYTPMQVPIIGENGQIQQDPQTGQVMTRPVLKHKVRESVINDMVAAPMFGMQATGGRLVSSGCIGYGVLKTGYRPDFETRYEPEAEQTVGLTDDGRLDLSKFARNKVDGSLIEGDDGKRLVERSEIPAWEDWFVDWVSYRRMIIDPDGENDDTRHAWVAEEIIKTLEDVQDDPLYKNTKDLVGGWEGEYENKSSKGKFFDFSDDYKDEAERVRLFEVWDLREKRHLVLADGHGEFLLDEPLPDGIYNHPYAFFRPNEELGEFYNRPIVTDLAPVAAAYVESRRLELVAMKRSVRKVLVRKGKMSPAAKRQLMSSIDMEIVEVDVNIGTPFSEIAAMLAPPPLSSDIYRNSEMISRDFDEIAGTHEAQRGGSSSDTTATEVRFAASAGTSRQRFERAQLGETYRVMFKKLDDSIEANMTMNRAVQLEDSDGQAFVGAVDSDMITGDFDVSVDVDDLGPSDDQAEMAHFISLLQVIGQNPFPFTQEPVVRAICEKVNMKDERFIKAMVQAAQQQAQMLMMQATPPPPNPEAGPPESEAQAISQNAAGGQAPRMQGAT